MFKGADHPWTADDIMYITKILFFFAQISIISQGIVMQVEFQSANLMLDAWSLTLKVKGKTGNWKMSIHFR